jgi:topoisomerase-4 subunit A
VREDAEKYGDKRRTFIEEAERITVSAVTTVADEPVTVILSRNGFLRTRQGHGIDRAALTWKEGDAELAIRETRTVVPIILFGANGRVFNVRASEIPGGKGDGVPATSLAETAGSPIVGMLAGAGDSPILMSTSGGNALRARLENFVTRSAPASSSCRSTKAMPCSSPRCSHPMRRKWPRYRARDGSSSSRSRR